MTAIRIAPILSALQFCDPDTFHQVYVLKEVWKRRWGKDHLLAPFGLGQTTRAWRCKLSFPLQSRPSVKPQLTQVSKRVEQLWSDCTFQCPLTSVTCLNGEVATSKACWCGFLACGLHCGHVTPVPYLVEARAVSDWGRSRRAAFFMRFLAIGVASFSNSQVFCPLVLLGCLPFSLFYWKINTHRSSYIFSLMTFDPYIPCVTTSLPKT